MKNVFALAIAGQLLIGTVARSGSFSVPDIEFPAGTCTVWEDTANTLELPRLTYLAALDGSLLLSRKDSQILPTCVEDRCFTTIVLGYFVPTWLDHADLTIRLAESMPTDTKVIVGMLNRQNGQVDEFPLAATQPLEVRAEDLPVSHPDYRLCGTVELYLALEWSRVSACGTGLVKCGRDVVALPDVTLGPR